MFARLSFRALRLRSGQAPSMNLCFLWVCAPETSRDVSTSLDMTENANLFIKTCETTSRENRLPGNRSANAVDSFHDVAAQESSLCQSYRNVLADSG